MVVKSKHKISYFNGKANKISIILVKYLNNYNNEYAKLFFDSNFIVILDFNIPWLLVLSLPLRV
jgi:hypothetical protein